MSAKTVRSTRKSDASSKNRQERLFPFTRENFVFMIIGLAVVFIGYLLMIGGGSSDPNQFHADQVYSFRRITLAPIVIILGFLIEIYAIMKKPKKEQADQ